MKIIVSWDVINRFTNTSWICLYIYRRSNCRFNCIYSSLCPDLFITPTCNPVWDDIQWIFLPGQSPIDMHGITARESRQKLKSFMNFIVKGGVYGSMRCWMYSGEWQKRELLCTILIWLFEKITKDHIVDLICAKFLEPISTWFREPMSTRICTKLWLKIWCMDHAVHLTRTRHAC